MSRLRSVRSWLGLLALSTASAVSTISSAHADATAPGSTIGALAEELAVHAGGTAGGGLAVAVVSTFADAPDGDTLARAVTSALVRALRARLPESTVVPVESPLADPAAQAQASVRAGERRVLFVKLGRRARFLEAEASLFESRAGALAALITPTPENLSTRTVRVPLNAELARFVGAPPRASPRTLVARSVALPGAGYLAMRAEDLDGDGRVELVLVARDRVDVVRLGRGPRGGLRLERVGEASLADLPRAPRRPRRAIATIVAHDGAMTARTSEHATSFSVALVRAEVSVTASETCRAEAFPVDDGCATPVHGRDYFHDEIAPPGAATPLPALSGFYARARARVPQASGAVLDAEATVSPRGRLLVSVGERRDAAQRVGAALAVADLDADGRLELLTSSAQPLGAGDLLTLRRFERSLVTVWESDPLEGSVLVAATTDLDADGGPELCAIEEPERAGARARLWMVR